MQNQQIAQSLSSQSDLEKKNYNHIQQDEDVDDQLPQQLQLEKLEAAKMSSFQINDAQINQNCDKSSSDQEIVECQQLTQQQILVSNTIQKNEDLNQSDHNINSFYQEKQFRSLQNLDLIHSFTDTLQVNLQLYKSQSIDGNLENFSQSEEKYNIKDQESQQIFQELPFQLEYSEPFKKLLQSYSQKKNNEKVEQNQQKIQKLIDDQNTKYFLKEPQNQSMKDVEMQNLNLQVQKNSIELERESFEQQKNSLDCFKEGLQNQRTTENDLKISYNINIVPAIINNDENEKKIQEGSSNLIQEKQEQYVIQIPYSNQQETINSNNAGRQSLIVQTILKNNTYNQANLLNAKESQGSLNQFGKSFAKLSIDLGIQKSIDIPSQVLSSSYLQGSDVFRTESQISLHKQTLKMIEKIKIYNKSAKLDLKDPEISDIAIQILQKNGKIAHEIKFLQKCIEGMPLFQKHQGLFEKANTSHHLFSQIKHIKYSKNHVIFNFGNQFQLRKNELTSFVYLIFINILGEYGYHYYIVLKGSVSCLIPQNQFKDELIQNQKKIEFMQQRIQKLKEKKVQAEKEEKEPQFIDIVMQAFKQKQESDYLTLLKNQGKPVPNITLSKRRNYKQQQEQNLTPEVLKQNQLFNQFLQKKGINKQQEVIEKSSFLRRKSKIGEIDYNKRKSKQDDEMNKSKNKQPQQNQQFLTVQQQNESPKAKEKPQNSTNQDEGKNQENQQIKQMTAEEQKQTFQEYLQKQFPQFFPVKTFVAGESFGEIALMTKERRTATMVCQEETHLMVLSKEGFDKIIGSFQQQILREKLEFLRKFQFLDSLPTSQLMSLLHYFKINNFTQKTVIYNEGDEADNIYFIKSGEVEVLKKVFIEDKKYHFNSDEESGKNLMEMNISLKNRIKQKRTETISIKLLGPGQCFGEEEIIEEKNKRQYKVIVTQQAEIFSIQKEQILTSLKSQKGLTILQKQKQIKQNWIHQRENFISTKKVETSQKIQEDMHIFEKNSKKKIDYSDMQKQIKESFLENSSGEQHNKLNLSYTSNSSTSRFFKSPPQSPQRSSSENQTEISSASQFSPTSQKNYPLMDSLKFNETIENSEQSSSSPRLKHSQFSDQLNSPASSSQQMHQSSADSSYILTSQYQNQEFKEERNQRIKNLQLDYIKRTPQINRILEKHSPQIPTISLFDCKNQSAEFEFNLNSKIVEMQEMTSRSKMDNYNLLIKNKNQIVEQKYDVNDRDKIQIDLFRDIKKKKYSNFNSNVNAMKKGDESRMSQHSNSNLVKEKFSETHKSFLRGNNSLSKLRDTQTKTQGSTFFNNQQLNSKLREFSNQILNERAKENQKEVSSINLNETVFKNQPVQHKPQFYSLSPHSLQQHLKKGTIMNIIKQCQSTQYTSQKHITEFTKEIRNKLQSKTSYSKALIKNYKNKQNIKSFISQIDFNNILNDKTSVTQQETTNQEYIQFQNEFSNQFDGKLSFQHETINDEITKQQQKDNDNNNKNIICHENYQANQSFNSTTQNGFRYNKEFNKSRMVKERIAMSPQNQKIDYSNQDFSQNNFQHSLIKKQNSRQNSAEHSKLNPHSSAQNYTFETFVNNSEQKNREQQKQKRQSLNLDGSKKIINREHQLQTKSFNKISNKSLHLKNSSMNMNITADPQQQQQKCINNSSQKSILLLNDQQLTANAQNIFTSAPTSLSENKKNILSFNGINKNIIRTFKLDKIIQSDHEKNFIKLAQKCQQNLQDLKQVDNFQINTNSVKFSLTQSQSAMVRNRHNQRLIDLCNLKKKINMSTILRDNNSSSNIEVTQSLRKRIDGKQGERDQSDQTKQDISLLQNLHIQQLQKQSKPS
ncbi:hypothetical protein ABPG74_015006 [Tetrahymena malaccensis]